MNTFGGQVRLYRSGTKEPEIVHHTHSIARGRGTGVADMAYSILRPGRPHRASGELANHVVEVMEAFDLASATGHHRIIASACPRPAALPTGLDDDDSVLDPLKGRKLRGQRPEVSAEVWPPRSGRSGGGGLGGGAARPTHHGLVPILFGGGQDLDFRDGLRAPEEIQAPGFVEMAAHPRRPPNRGSNRDRLRRRRKPRCADPAIGT